MEIEGLLRCPERGSWEGGDVWPSKLPSVSTALHLQENFELTHETLYLAVKLMDHYLVQVAAMRDKLQLIGSTAILIASKFEVSPPKQWVRRGTGDLGRGCSGSRLQSPHIPRLSWARASALPHPRDLLWASRCLLQVTFQCLLKWWRECSEGADMGVGECLMGFSSRFLDIQWVLTTEHLEAPLRALCPWVQLWALLTPNPPHPQPGRN